MVKLQIGIHAQDISLYINSDFCSGRIKTLVVMAPYSFHRLLMGKMKIDNVFCLNGDIWNLFIFTEMFFSCLIRFICPLSKLPNLFGCQGNKKGKF